MSGFAKKLKDTYAGRALRPVQVPEWDMTLYIRPLTIGQASRFNAETDLFRRACRIIQVRSKQADGSPMFDEEDFDAMVSHGEQDLVAKVVSSINDLDADPEDEGKNS